MKKLNLPDEIKATIGTIKTNIHELEYQVSFHLAGGLAHFYTAGVINESEPIISTLYCMMGASILAVTVHQIEQIKEKKREIEEYKQGEYIQDSINKKEEKEEKEGQAYILQKKQNQLDIAKWDVTESGKKTLINGILVGSCSYLNNIAPYPEILLPAIILNAGDLSLNGYKTIKAKKKVKQLEKEVNLSAFNKEKLKSI